MTQLGLDASVSLRRRLVRPGAVWSVLERRGRSELLGRRRLRWSLDVTASQQTRTALRAALAHVRHEFD